MNFAPAAAPPLMPKTTIEPPLPWRYLLLSANLRIVLAGRGSGPTRPSGGLAGAWRRRGRFRSGAPCAAAGSRCPAGRSRRCRARCRRRGCAAGRCACAGCRRAARAARAGRGPSAGRGRSCPAASKSGCLPAGPVEFPGVDDDAADAGAVAAEPLGERVDDDVRAVVDRAGEDRGWRRWNRRSAAGRWAWAIVGDGLEVGDFERRVGDGLAEEGAGFVDRSRRRSSAGSVESTKRTSMPSAGRMSLNWV